MKKLKQALLLVTAFVCLGNASQAAGGEPPEFAEYRKIEKSGKIHVLTPQQEQARQKLLSFKLYRNAAEHMKTVDFDFPSPHDTAMAFLCMDQKAIRKIADAGFTKWNDPEILLHAIRGISSENILFLVGKEADLNCVDSNGITPLSLLLMFHPQNPVLMEYLFSRGMKAKADPKGKALNPLYFVPSKELLELLMSHGAVMPPDILFAVVDNGEDPIDLVKTLIEKYHADPALEQEGKYATDRVKKRNTKTFQYLTQEKEKALARKKAKQKAELEAVAKKAKEARDKWLRSKKDDLLVQHALKYLAAMPADKTPHYRAYLAVICGDMDELKRLLQSGKLVHKDIGLLFEAAKTPFWESFFNLNVYGKYGNHDLAFYFDETYGSDSRFPASLAAKKGSRMVLSTIMNDILPYPTGMDKMDALSIMDNAIESGDTGKVSFLLGKKICLKDSDHRNFTFTILPNRIYAAARTLEMLQFIKNILKTDFRQTNGILKHAAYYGKTDVCKYLLDNGAAPDKQDEEIVTAAIYSGNLELVRFFVEKGWALNKKNALLKAAECSSDKGLEIVKYLFSKGVKAGDAKADELIKKAVTSGSAETLKLLVSSGVKPAASDPEKLICKAAETGAVELVKYLLSSGIFPADKISTSAALVDGIKSGNLKMVKLLVFKGFPAKDHDPVDTVMRAVVSSLNSEIFDYIEKQKLIPMTPDSYRSRPMLLADAAENPINFLKLVKLGFDPKETLDGETVLHLAARSRSKGAVRFLVDYGFSPFDEDSNGDTPQHCAVGKYLSTCNFYFLNWAFYSNRYRYPVNKQGLTPRALAKRKGVKWLN